MRLFLAKLVLFLLTAGAMMGCSAQQADKRPEQSAMVTAANEIAVMARLRAIASGEAQYMAETGGDYGTLNQLIQKRYANDPSSGKLTGYKFDVQVKRGGFQITAVPEKYG